MLVGGALDNISGCGTSQRKESSVQRVLIEGESSLLRPEYGVHGVSGWR